MAPKLHTSQIFKGRAYEPKYRAYGFCLNKKRSKFNLAFRSNFFKTWKKILHTWNLQEFKDHSTQNASKTVNSLSANLSLRYRNARHHSLVSHVPLMFLYKQRVISWNKWKRRLNDSDAKRCEYWFFFEGPKCNCLSAGCILVLNSACYDIYDVFGLSPHRGRKYHATCIFHPVHVSNKKWPDRGTGRQMPRMRALIGQWF